MTGANRGDSVGEGVSNDKKNLKLTLVETGTRLDVEATGIYKGVNLTFPERTGYAKFGSGVQASIQNRQREWDGAVLNWIMVIDSNKTDTVNFGDIGGVDISQLSFYPSQSDGTRAIIQGEKALKNFGIVDSNGNVVWRFDVNTPAVGANVDNIMLFIGTRTSDRRPFVIVASDKASWPYGERGDISIRLHKDLDVDKSYSSAYEDLIAKYVAFLTGGTPLNFDDISQLHSEQGYYNIPKRSPQVVAAWGASINYTAGQVVVVNNDDGHGRFAFVAKTAGVSDVNLDLLVQAETRAALPANTDEDYDTPGHYIYRTSDNTLHKKGTTATSAYTKVQSDKTFRESVVAESESTSKWTHADNADFPLANLGYYNVDPDYVFSSVNVVDGLFVKSSTRSTARFNSVQVRFLDKEAGFVENAVTVVDPHDIARRGEIQRVVGGFGIQTPGQAMRLARYMLFSSLYETENMSFTTGLIGSSGYIQPGSIIGTQDTYGHKNRLGGRIIGGSIENGIITIQLDHPPFDDDSDHKLIRFCWEAEDKKLYVAADFTGEELIGSTITIPQDDFPDSAVPLVDGTWAANPDGLGDGAPIELWRVISIRKRDDDHTHEIQATKFEPFKFAVCDRLDIPYDRMVEAFRAARDAENA